MNDRRQVDDPGGWTCAQLISAILDPGSFHPWPNPAACTRMQAGQPGPQAVVAGEGRIRDIGVAVVATDFSVRAGTIGPAEGELIAGAFEQAGTRSLPLVAILSSGGIRLQNGAQGFVQIAKIVSAARRLRCSELLFLVYLGHPSLGGALVSLGSLGQVVFAAPHAVMGLAGPRVYQALRGVPLPAGLQLSERAANDGLIDGVLDPYAFRHRAGSLLSVVSGSAVTGCSVGSPAAPGGRAALQAIGTGCGGVAPQDAGVVLARSRDPGRQGLRDLLARCTEVTLLHGAGVAGGDDPSLLLGVARLGVTPMVIVGHDRAAQAVGRGPMAAGFRKARRGIALAGELHLPLLTVIDTGGADVSEQAEAEGIAFEIGRCIDDLLCVRVATVSLLLGEGAGGAALALLPADRVLCAENAWLGPLAPEATAAVFQKPERVPDSAALKPVISWQLLGEGLVDGVLPEFGPDVGDPGGSPDFLGKVEQALAAEFSQLLPMEESMRLRQRSRRYREIVGVLAKS